MASAQPLLPGPGAAQKEAKHTKFSIFYGANEYLETLSKKYEEYDELAELLKVSPDGGADADAFPAAKDDQKEGESKKSAKMLSLDVDDDKRSKRTKRSVPTPNVPEPMPSNLAFMFAKITLEQKLYMWNIYTLIFVAEALSIVAYWALLKFDLLPFWVATIVMGTIMAALGIQNVYILHDVIHGATFPPYEWQAYITHPFADFFSLPWMEMIMEHNRHHNSTFDLLNHGEFGWDPANWLYVLQEWTPAWYGWLTVPLVPLWHFIGASDTGSLFAILWWMNFPDACPSGKCDKAFWTKWLPARVKHNLFVLSCWACVWLLGSVGLGLPLSEGWKFTLIVSAMFRTGFSLAWTFFTNINHSHWWNEFLASDPERTWPFLHRFMAFCLGGSHRWNEMLFHDIHHMCPGRIGAMSQRGRFHGWQKVHDACVEILANGLWKHDDPETQMEQHQKRRSLVLKSRTE
eukprot:CAMPEP_0206482622 /NCGR_PEP_ID=MMETSP0324_2-20121206/38974_1 /ASSEMBLY_ACC=CAM_ASM_000836 /TAXON_ID=2866 /ORGANISM="Crypthecodinium cohnii, Strain Seligo" /LENGTH=460 /DNA_ID=CAMNT_0053960585 /DNA_START=110 /DNA_END=1492 /DNA_ORIENTATION=-